MKHLFLLLAVFLVVACSKAPSEQPVAADGGSSVSESVSGQQGNFVTEEFEASTFEDVAVPQAAAKQQSAKTVAKAAVKPCGTLPAKLESCQAATCSQAMDLFGVTIENVFKVNGPNAGKCNYSTSMRANDGSGNMQEQDTMICNFTPAQQKTAAAYLKTYFNSKGNISVQAEISMGGINSYNETIDGKAVNNPFTGYLADGTCMTPGAPAQELSCVGEGSMTVMRTDANGNEVETVIQCQPETGMEEEHEPSALMPDGYPPVRS